MANLHDKIANTDFNMTNLTHETENWRGKFSAIAKLIELTLTLTLSALLFESQECV